MSKPELSRGSEQFQTLLLRTVRHYTIETARRESELGALPAENTNDPKCLLLKTNTCRVWRQRSHASTSHPPKLYDRRFSPKF